MHKCDRCGYGFPTPDDLARHQSDGRGCPEGDD